MIIGLITICGTMLGIITGFILGRISRVTPAPCEIPPKIVEDKRPIESINARCEFPKRIMLGSEEENRDTILKSLSYEIADQIYKKRSKYIEYMVEEDYRTNRIVAQGVLRVVKNP